MKIFFAGLALCSLPLFAQTTPVVVQDVRLIDGSGSPPVEHVSILIANGKIQSIVTGSQTAEWPDGARLLKLTGKTVMPGLIAGHGHLGLTKGAGAGPDDFTPENIERQLAQYERYGITTIMSLGANKDLLYQLRSAQEKGELGGATILTADHGIGVPGGAPAMNVEPGRVYRPATPDEARAAVREMATRSPDLIKVWVDDNLHKLPAPKPAVYEAVIDEAHKNNLRVAAHVYYLGDSKRLLEDGVDILAHSIRDQEIDADAVSEITRRKVYYIPTLQLEEAFFIYANHPAWMDSPFFRNAAVPELWPQVTSEAATRIHRTALQTAMVNLKKLNDSQALIAFGTDSGANPYRIQGFAEHRELELMVEAGMTPLAVIHSATAVNAAMLHIEEKTGTVKVGKQADLLVLDADPSSDIKNTQRIAMVLHNGNEVKR